MSRLISREDIDSGCPLMVEKDRMKLDDEILLNLDPNPVPCLNNTGHVSDWFKSLINGLNWNVRQIQKKL